MVTRQDLIQL